MIGIMIKGKFGGIVQHGTERNISKYHCKVRLEKKGYHTHRKYISYPLEFNYLTIIMLFNNLRVHLCNNTQNEIESILKHMVIALLSCGRWYGRPRLDRLFSIMQFLRK